MELDKKVLYVGLDDSNHAGDRRGEILTATFSFNYKDSLVQRFKNRKDYPALQYWLNDQNSPVDYRFGILIEDSILRSTQPNLPLVAPYLINSFLLDNPCRNVNQINIYFDGVLKKRHKDYLRLIFSNQFPKVVLSNFFKDRNVHVCPKVVYMADTLAHDLFETASFRELTEHEKWVYLPQDKILSTFYSLRY